jgi:hypothetical protein
MLSSLLCFSSSLSIFPCFVPHFFSCLHSFSNLFFPTLFSFSFFFSSLVALLAFLASFLLTLLPLSLPYLLNFSLSLFLPRDTGNTQHRIDSLMEDGVKRKVSVK